MSHRELQQIQFEFAKSIVGYAAQRIPYYNALFANFGISPDAIRDSEDFAKIPVSTKAMIRPAYPEQIYARSSWLDVKTKTSGSTGEPFECVIDGRSHPWRLAGRYLFDSWMDINPEESWLRITDDSGIERISARLFRGEMRAPIELTTRPRFVELIRRIDRDRPSGLSGMASSLALLAAHIRDTGITPSHKLKGVFSTAETLLTYQKELISSLLSPNLFNRYGLGEFGGYVAQDCENHGGFHFNPFLVYAEVVGHNGNIVEPGEIGRLILTDLQNRAMPLIRYDTGDLATAGVECRCGRGFPILAKIVGRDSEYIRTKVGLLPSLKVTDEFGTRFAKYVRAFQFIQDKNGRVLVKVAPTAIHDLSFDGKVAHFLACYFADFEVESVPEIRPDRSGKRPVLKSVQP